MANTADTTGQADQQPAGGADDENAALVAELEAEQGGAPVKPNKPAKGKPAAPAAEADDSDDDAAEVPDVDVDVEEADDDSEDDDATATSSEDDDEDDSDAETADDSDADDELDEDAAKDPELVKRHAALRRTAQRQRQRLEQERAGLDRDRTAFQAETKELRQAVERIRGLAARAKVDPIALLEAHGLGQDDMEYVAQQAYARSKAAAGKPEYRGAAERAQRERELADRAAATEREIAELKAKLEGKDAQAAADRELDAYFGRVFRKATDATPITARLIAKRPKVAREELAATAAKLGSKLGRLPTVAELLAAHERREVRALKFRGIEPPAPAGAKPATATEEAEETTAASKKKGAKPGAKPGTAKPKPAADEDDDTVIPSTADLVRELAAQRN